MDFAAFLECGVHFAQNLRAERSANGCARSTLIKWLFEPSVVVFLLVTSVSPQMKRSVLGGIPCVFSSDIVPDFDCVCHPPDLLCGSIGRQSGYLRVDPHRHRLSLGWRLGEEGCVAGLPVLRSQVFIEYVAIDALKYSSALGPFGDRGDTPLMVPWG